MMQRLTNTKITIAIAIQLVWIELVILNAFVKMDMLDMEMNAQVDHFSLLFCSKIITNFDW